MVASTLTLSAISCDRFIAVIFPLRTRVTQRKARFVVNVPTHSIAIQVILCVEGAEIAEVAQAIAI